MKPESYAVLLITSKALKATPLELAKSRLGGEMMP